METVTEFSPTTAPVQPLTPPPTCQAFAVKMGYVWLMVLAPFAGLITAVVGFIDEPRLLLLALAAVLLALGYWGWHQGYRKVQLELRPDCLLIRPAAPGPPAEDLPLARIAHYLRPEES